MLRAAAESGLELSAEILGIGMAQQEFCERPGVRSDVEYFVLANTGVGASGDVANRIAAGLARGDIRSRETPHQRRRVVNVDVVELESLARGDVGDTVGIFLGQI